MSQETLRDLEERTYRFAEAVAVAVKKLPKTTSNFEYIKQVVRSSSSIGANYIEANESLGTKDFVMRLRISRKEAKESVFWIRLLMSTNDGEEISEFKPLMQEAIELKKILSAIINKCTNPK
jgi:four helix bundle protein